MYPDVKVWVDVSGNPLSDPATWTEITEWVCHESIEIARGVSQPGDVQPGTLSLSLIDDGRFDPLATAGAYYPDFGLRTRIYVTTSDNWSGAPATYPLFTGFITSLRQRWNYRAEQVADVTAIDLLGVLATVELPESAWDHVIANRSGKVAWHKLGSDTTSVVRDYSGNGADAKWVTYEGAVGPYGGQRTPDVIVQAGVSDPIIAQVDRPAQSWGKMIAEAGQPLAAIDTTGASGPRASSVVCNQTTAALQEAGQAWTVELWAAFRPAIDLTGDYEWDDHVASALFQWGDNGIGDAIGPMLRFAIPAFQRYVIGQWYNSTGTIGASVAQIVLPVADQSQPLHLVFACSTSGTVTVYVNGTSVGTLSVSSAAPARGFPLVIAPTCYASTPTDNVCSWWGTIGDVVIYNRAITSGEVTASYVAGRWGRTDSTAGALLAGEAIEQAAGIAAADVEVDAGQVEAGGHQIVPGPFARRSALDYMRLAASSDGGVLWCDPNGYLSYRGPNWPVDPAQLDPDLPWVLTDDDITDPMGGYHGDLGGRVVGHTGASLLMDEQGVANDVTVQWRGGEVRHVRTTSVATYGRLRASVSTALSDVRDAQARAEWEAWRRGSPAPKVSSVGVEPAAVETDWYCVLATDVLDPVRVIVTRPDGTQIDGSYVVMGIQHSIDMGQASWRTTFSLAPFNSPAAPFTIGTSELNGPDVVWY